MTLGDVLGAMPGLAVNSPLPHPYRAWKFMILMEWAYTPTLSAILCRGFGWLALPMCCS